MNEGKTMKKKQDPPVESGHTNSGRRDFLAGALGAAGLAATLNAAPAAAQTSPEKSGPRRVCLLIDAETHMMPALAKEMARRNHDLVIANVKDGLPDELKQLGARVEVVPGNLDIAKLATFESMVEAAQDRFGRVDSACVRTGYHTTGEIMDITTADAQALYEGNLLSAIYALQALLKPMLAQGSGQIVINTSATGIRGSVAGTMYSACRAGANMLVRCAALTAAPKGVAINATGTYAMNYSGFLDDIGWDNPEVQKAVLASLPTGQLVEPEQAAHFTATLIDGVGTSQTGQFFSIDNGWAFQ
jgi:NAD(P)-dependent dehydrogenase (short-subunit alcohol dehydrogenase family)